MSAEYSLSRAINITGATIAFYTPFSWHYPLNLLNTPGFLPSDTRYRNSDGTLNNNSNIEQPSTQLRTGYAGYLYYGTLPSVWYGMKRASSYGGGESNFPYDGESITVTGISEFLNYTNRYSSGTAFNSVNECVPSPYLKNNDCYLNVINADPYCCSQAWDENCQNLYNNCAGGPLIGLPPLSCKANLTAKINNSAGTYIAQFSTSNNFSSIISSNASPTDEFNLIKFNVSNLNFNTKYFVRIVDSNGSPIDSYVGSFKTPNVGPHNFKFGFASCSRSTSNEVIYDNIANKAINNELDFFIHLGDMHYSDIATNNESDFQQAFDNVFLSPRQNNCWKNLAMYYMWDDHDYGPNDTDKNNPSRNAAIAAYRRRVPSPPLAKNGSTDSPYYSFVRGRVRFIITDIRSEREPKGTYPSNDIRQQVFSENQKQWFFDEMLTAKNNREFIIWANTKPWISSIENNKDDWGGYHAARLEIVNFINEHGLTARILIISGDMHALAYDNGSSSNNYGNLKVCHAAALDEQARSKGGPYTIGPIAQDSGTGWVTQYGIIEIIDNGGNSINVQFKGIVISKINFSESTPIDVNFNLFLVNS